jgi:hypothetical protein
MSIGGTSPMDAIMAIRYIQGPTGAPAEPIRSRM